MIGITRGFSTLVGAAVAGFLIWLAVQMGAESNAAYWATYGLVAAAGLTMALSQIVGGWTKWGWPRLSLGVFLLGFLPVLLLGGWVLLARQPADFFNTSNWSRDLGVFGVVSDLGELLGAVAFLIGLAFGFTFDTEGPRHAVVPDGERVRGREGEFPAPRVHQPARAAGEEPTRRQAAPPVDGSDRTEPVRSHPDEPRRDEHTAADEPLTAERSEQAQAGEERGRGHRAGLRERLTGRRRGQH